MINLVGCLSPSFIRMHPTSYFRGYEAKKSTRAMARWHWLERRPCIYVKYLYLLSSSIRMIRSTGKVFLIYITFQSLIPTGLHMCVLFRSSQVFFTKILRTKHTYLYCFHSFIGKQLLYSILYLHD